MSKKLESLRCALCMSVVRLACLDYVFILGEINVEDP